MSRKKKKESTQTAIDPDLMAKWKEFQAKNRSTLLGSAGPVREIKTPLLKKTRPLSQLMTPEVRAQFTGISLGLLPEGQVAKSTQFYLFKEGLWCQRTLPMGVVLTQQSKDTANGLPSKPNEWKEGFSLSLPKIPSDLILQIVTFFKAVNTKYKAEAYASLFWNGTQYHVEVPEQIISGGRVKHQQQRDLPGEIEVLQIHSHDTMPAFFSGVDNEDEQEHGQRIYAVFGKLDQVVPESKWRVNAGGVFYPVEMSSLIDWPNFTVEQHINGAELFPMSGSVKGETMQPVAWDPCEGVTFPDEWMMKVSKQAVTICQSNMPYTPYVHEGGPDIRGNFWDGGIDTAAYGKHQNWHDLATAHLKETPASKEPLVMKGGMLLRGSDYDCLAYDCLGGD
jgi:PRTRC genetic system protein A